MTKPLFIGSEIYRNSSYGDWHPLRVPRVSTVMDLSRALGWLPVDQYITSPTAKPAALTSFHTAEYVSALSKAEKDQEVPAEVKERHHLGIPSNPIFPEMYRRPATSVGAALLAGELLRDGGVVHAPGCGTHHGMPDRANGFCYLNDPVFAIQSLFRNGCARIAYVDIDAHHPDGVEFAFEDDPNVLMVSIHEENRWPRTGALEDRGEGNVWNLPVPRGLNDDEMSLFLKELLLPLVQNFRPDAIVLQCGADAVEEDPQSKLSLSNRSHYAVVRELMPLSDRLLVTGGGGYNPWSVGRLWTGVWGVLNGIDPPSDLTDEVQAVLRDLKWTGQRRFKRPLPNWVTSLIDPPNNGPIRDEVCGSVGQLVRRMRATQQV